MSTLPNDHCAYIPLATKTLPVECSTSPIADRPPLRVPITPYRLFSIAVVLNWCTRKALCFASGRPVILGAWFGGLAAVFILYPLSWSVNVNNLPWLQWFFYEDLSHPAFHFLKENASPRDILELLVMIALNAMVGLGIAAGIYCMALLEVHLAIALIAPLACGAIHIGSIKMFSRLFTEPFVQVVSSCILILAALSACFYQLIYSDDYVYRKVLSSWDKYL
ncbi:hypothetical protein FIBSPDRAFT_286782 [Athelia psychrophila]|uniref:Uncharacterized protein n=1 Tax=Athelia psychrophila TaxID=1759441 RepID=A0A167XRJ5_9AGAM|nr:hypothetical protein FIBSPDRAFT_286782 [Fibularhizoctonia sp. CBS 109695]